MDEGTRPPAESVEANPRRRVVLRSMKRRARTHAPLLAGVSVFVLASVLLLGLVSWRNARAGDRFDFTRWEIESVANKWVFAVGARFRDDPAADEAIARYFSIEPRASGEDADVAAVRDNDLENVVEAAIEGRIDAVIRTAGIKPPLALPGPLAVFPPVDFELVETPHVLVISPRDEIRRLSDAVLRPDLPLDALYALEASAERDNPNVSALVVRTGGVATYPAIVTNDRSYAATVGTAAHEWVHQYLAFFPLGRSYFSSADTKALNETVAEVAGSELERMVLDRFGDPTAKERARARAEAGPPVKPALDRDEVLRNLRLEVDRLLAEGAVDDAEARMEQVRQELEEAGISFRRLNQAYFAWFGTYAARPDSVDPLGAQMREILERSGSLGRFLELIRGINTRAEVEALLEELQASAASTGAS